MYACIYVCVYVCIYVCMYVCSLLPLLLSPFSLPPLAPLPSPFSAPPHFLRSCPAWGFDLSHGLVCAVSSQKARKCLMGIGAGTCS